MKPYQTIPIQECHEPLVPIPLDQFAMVTPHPYEALGAPYGDRSPYWLRQSVLQALSAAQVTLQAQHPGWRIQIFDAYRPVAVQQFMVEYTAHTLAQQQGKLLDTLSKSDRQALMAKVYEFWAPPSSDPQTPPPHSTGAAVDITLVDAAGNPVDMGSPIDEVSPRSHPDYFKTAVDQTHQTIHHHRRLLRQVMAIAQFQPHPNEWWHFSLGDQLWAWLTQQTIGAACIAHYGGVDAMLRKRSAYRSGGVN